MSKETKGWTPERRAAQRERMLKNKPWEKSTGPKTREGKVRASRNAWKTGQYARERKALLLYFKACRDNIRDWNNLFPAREVEKRTKERTIKSCF